MTIDFPNLRVAVADDSHYMRQILRTILHGFGVRHITTPPTARRPSRRSSIIGPTSSSSIG